MKNTKSKNKNLKFAAVMILMISFFQNAFTQPKEDWVKRFDGYSQDENANSVVVDKAGNIYFTGSSDGKEFGKNFLTVKYSQEGDIAWYQRYEGPDTEQDKTNVSNAITVDEQGNVYATGFSYRGRTGRDFCTIKYDSKGNEKWIQFFDGGVYEGSQEEATCIDVDDEGNVYVGGISNGNSGGFDAAIVKYDKDGVQLWSAGIGGSALRNDEIVSVRADKSGFVYAAGTVDEILTNKDYFVAKFSKSGEQEWISKYNGVSGNLNLNDDELNAMEIDADGNIYVTGGSFMKKTRKDFLTIKYNAQGGEEWISRFDNAPALKDLVCEDEAKALKLSASGNVFITGKTFSEKTGNDFLTLKLNEKGDVVWSKSYNNTEFGVGEEEANAIAIDSKENVIVTGYTNSGWFSNSCAPGKDFLTIKYSSGGEQKWIREYNGYAGFELNDDEAIAVSVNSKGKIFVMGRSYGEQTGLDYCMIRYSEYSPVPDAVSGKDAEYKLSDNYPNPFNPSTKISFVTPIQGLVKLSVYDITGREVKVILNGTVEAGRHEYVWNATEFSSGTYFYKIQTGEFVQTKKMLLVK